VIDGDLDSHFLQAGESSLGVLDVANHDAFGDLQAHRAGVDAELIDAVRDSADEAVSKQLDRRDIQSQHDISSQAMRSPPAEVSAGCSDHPSAQLSSDIDRFGYADERLRQQQAARRVLPADQRLDGQDLAGPHVDLGQIVEYKGVAVDHTPKM